MFSFFVVLLVSLFACLSVKKIKKLKSFPSHKALISVSAALSQTPAETAIQQTQTRGQCVAWSACLAGSMDRYQFIGLLLGEQRQD